MARSIQSILGYASWDKFTNVIRKAIFACEGTGTEPKNHFSQTGNMVAIGSGAKRPEQDYFLSRYGCYLVAMNGEATKPEVAAAQTYFAVQTRRQEIADSQERMLTDVDKRIALRQRLTDATKHLNSAAKQAGVQSYALFAHAGYVGLYGMGLKSIKARKRISEKERLFDRAGRAELAMNEFRATQAEQVLQRKQVRGEEAANEEHKRIGREVRHTIRRLGGTMPEDLPAEPSLTKLLSKKSKALPPPPNQ
jgi:DNA-damage-inducible protein D